MNTFRTSPKDYECGRPPGLLRSGRPRGARSPILFLACSLVVLLAALFFGGCQSAKPLEVPVCDIDIAESKLSCDSANGLSVGVGLETAAQAGYVCMAAEDFAKILERCKRERTLGR